MFWRGLVERHTRTRELIEDANQDGYGIGVVWHPANRNP